MIRKMFLSFILMFTALTLQAAEVIDINTADAATIEHELKGVGSSKAQAIVKYRQKNGPYKSVDELVNVSGIGEKTLEKIRAQISVSKVEKANN